MRNRTSIDRDTLPDALLETAKVHMRVEFTRDDDYIALCIKRAIDFFERTTEMSVNPATYEWSPVGGKVIGGQGVYMIPFQPQPSVLVRDVDGNNVTTQYEVRGYGSPDEYGPRALVSLNGAIPSDNVVVVTVGYEDMDALPPGILNFILQAASWFYEYREAGPMPGADGVPYLNQLLTSFWVPRA